MKYMASTSPMTIPKRASRRLCASGWRETPGMVALPPRPSPIAAPMAPPPSASPAPISAPATAIAWFIQRDLLYLAVRSRRRVRAVVLLFQALAGLAEVHDREQHEDERLQAADDEDVERLPDHPPDQRPRDPTAPRPEQHGHPANHQPPRHQVPQ